MKRDILLNAVVAALFGALSLAAVLFLVPQGVETPGSVDNAALSPDFWPKVIAWSMLAASIMLMVESVGLARLSTKSDKTSEATDGEDLHHGVVVGLVRAVLLILLLFGFYTSLERYGLVVPSIGLIAVVMMYFGERKPLTILCTSISVPLILYGFFRYIAGISIPLGIFG